MSKYTTVNVPDDFNWNDSKYMTVKKLEESHKRFHESGKADEIIKMLNENSKDQMRKLLKGE